MLPEDVPETALSTMTATQIQRDIDYRTQVVDIISNFVPTSEPADFAKFDDNSRQMILSANIHKVYEPSHYTLFNYDQLVDFELIEDGSSVANGGLGSAVVGGLLFGEMGAIVGAAAGRRKIKPMCESLCIKLTVKDFTYPTFYINLITDKIKKSSFKYKSIMKRAQEVLSQLQLVVNSQSENQSVDATDEIRKYKALLDDGLITQEEYEIKKNELLGL